MFTSAFPKFILDELAKNGEMYCYALNGKITNRVDVWKGTPVCFLKITIDPDHLNFEDRMKMDQENIVYCLISPCHKKCIHYFPSKFFEKHHYLGRPYIYGIFDCYTLFRDYFSKEKNINVTWNIDRPYEWWKDRQSFFVEFAQPNNFKEQTSDLKKHDVLTFGLNCSIANHIAIYMGDGKILHHMYERYSCIEELTKGMKQNLKQILRHESEE